VHTTPDFNEDIAVALSEQIANLIDKAIDDNSGLNPHEVITACMGSVACAVTSIQCPGCRKLAVESIQKTLMQVLATAPGQPDSAHRH
jgi:hypothetical protein